MNREKETTPSATNRAAYSLLKFGFILLPIIAGLDKFFNVLTDWTVYLAPIFPDLTGLSKENFMNIVGAIEIAAGLGVAFRPRIFSNVVALWMMAIVVNLLILGAYYDIALRDFGLSIAAFYLGRLAILFEAPEKQVRARRSKTDLSYGH